MSTISSQVPPLYPEVVSLLCAPGLTNHTEEVAARPSTAPSVSIPRRAHPPSIDRPPNHPVSPCKQTVRTAAWGTPIGRSANGQNGCLRIGAGVSVPATSWGHQHQGAKRAPMCVRQSAWTAQPGTRPLQRPASNPASPSRQPAFAPTLVAPRQRLRCRTAEGLLVGAEGQAAPAEQLDVATVRWAAQVRPSSAVAAAALHEPLPPHAPLPPRVLFAATEKARPSPLHPLAAPTRENAAAAGAAALSMTKPISPSVGDARAAADRRTEEIRAAVARMAVAREVVAKAVQPAQSPQEAAERRALVELCMRSCCSVGQAEGRGQEGRGQGGRGQETAAAVSSVGLSQLYAIGKPIGEGAYGFVRIAQQRLTRQLVAVKTFDKLRLREPAARRRLDNEIRVLQRVQHTSIVRLFEVFESAKRVHLCMEHVPGGTLARLVRQHGRLPEPLARKLLRQLLGALGYLHQRCISHRDVKLENVLIDAAGDAKLIDFGFAIVSRARLRVPCGSLSYTVRLAL